MQLFQLCKHCCTVGVLACDMTIAAPVLQDRVRELESEIEWVRAERQDAQQAAQREQKQAQARIKEAEDAAARAKAARRLASLATCIHSSCV